MKTHKWSHYADCYQKHLPPNPKKLLEIGVADGGSLLSWRSKFPTCEIHGADIDPRCKKMEQFGFTIHILNQANRAQLNRLPDGFDLIIDDGGHRPYQIVNTFQVLFEKLNMGGLYVIEDLHMSEAVVWRMWSKIRAHPRDILVNLYKTMNKWKGSEIRWIDHDGPVERFPAEIHLYPNIMFIVKKSVTVWPTSQEVE
jgi:hypothetical protein